MHWQVDVLWGLLQGRYRNQLGVVHVEMLLHGDVEFFELSL